MPISIPGVMSLIGNTAQMVGQGIQNRRQRKFIAEQNQRDRDFAGQMFWETRKQALDDWHMNNAYNSPQQQMARLREAGLNPNLIYASGAENTANAVRQTTAPAANSHMAPTGVNPLSNASSMLTDYLKAEQTTVQTDNLKAQNEVFQKQAALLDAQALKTLVETDTGKFNLAQMNRLKDIVIERALLENSNLSTNIISTRDANNRANQKFPLEMQQAAENVLKTKLEQMQIRATTNRTDAETSRIRKDIELMQVGIESGIIKKQIDEELLKLWQKGVNPNDPIIYRSIAKLIDTFIEEYGKPNSKLPSPIRK